VEEEADPARSEGRVGVAEDSTPSSLGAGAEADEKEGRVVGRPLSTLLDSSSISACPLVSRPEAGTGKTAAAAAAAAAGRAGTRLGRAGLGGCD